MRQGFIRGVWGSYLDYKDSKSKVEYYTKMGRLKIDNDIKLVNLNPFEKDLNLTVYVYGEDNYKILVNKGFKCRLMDKRPNVFEIKEHWWIHKLEILKAAVDDYDEFSFIDWDCIPFFKIPSNYWDIMRKKLPIQVPLRIYKRRMATWRTDGKRLISCAAFIYVREKNIPDELMKTWKGINANVTEEVVLSRYIDEVMGGWKGMDKYFEIAEPELCYLHLVKCQIFPKELLDEKRKFLWHVRCFDVSAILDKIDEKNGFEDVIGARYKDILPKKG